MSELTRRDFMTCAAAGAAGATLMPFACSTKGQKQSGQKEITENNISLATWSLNRTYAKGYWELKDIPRICREDFNISGMEYVTHFFTDVRDNYLRPLKKAAEDYGVLSVLVMVDREGDMVSKYKKERILAVMNHRKWVEIAAYLDCHAIRCNATIAFDTEGDRVTPDQDPDSLDRAAESFRELLDYSKPFGISIVIEPHGSRVSRDPHWLAALAKKIDDPYFGLLPDFGNFNVNSEEDVYEAVRLTMPYAKGVSVKGGWNPDGTHPNYSLERCLEIARDSGFIGYWGIESRIRRENDFYQKSSLEDIKKDEWQAVQWTKEAIEKVVLI